MLAIQGMVRLPVEWDGCGRSNGGEDHRGDGDGLGEHSGLSLLLGAAIEEMGKKGLWGEKYASRNGVGKWAFESSVRETSHFISCKGHTGGIDNSCSFLVTVHASLELEKRRPWVSKNITSS